MSPLSAILVLLAAAAVCESLVRVPMSRTMRPHQYAQHVTGRTAVLLENYRDVFYLANITFGRDEKNFVVVMDTGSSNLFVPAPYCVNCGPHKHTYNCPSNATKGLGLLGYGSAMTVGMVCEDSVKIGNLTVRDQLFVVSAFEWGSSVESPFDGIMGLGLKSIEGKYLLTDKDSKFEEPPNFLESMQQQGQIPKSVFSVYLNSKSEFGSELIFGGSDPNHYVGDLSYLPLVEEMRQFWAVNVEGFSIEGVTVAKNFTAVMDTGTANLVAPIKHLFTVLRTISEKAEVKFFPVNEFILLVAKDISHFRPINISIAGLEFTLKPQDYTFPLKNGNYLVRIQFAVINQWIFGEVFLPKAYVEFDMENKRIGFAHVKH